MLPKLKNTSEKESFKAEKWQSIRSKLKSCKKSQTIDPLCNENPKENLEKGWEDRTVIMTKNSSATMSDAKSHIQDAEKTVNGINANKIQPHGCRAGSEHKNFYCSSPGGQFSDSMSVIL